MVCILVGFIRNKLGHDLYSGLLFKMLDKPLMTALLAALKCACLKSEEGGGGGGGVQHGYTG